MRLAFFFLLITTLHAGATDSTLSQTFLKVLKKTALDPGKIKIEKAPSTIGHIKLLDVRPDRQRLGLYSTVDIKMFELVFENDLSLEQLLNQKLTSSEGTTELLFVVKEFWMTEGLTGKDLEASTTSFQSFTTRLQCKIDIFIANQGNYHALHKVDTTFYRLNTLTRCANELIADFLTNTRDDVQKKIGEGNYARKKAFNLEFIKSHYSAVNENLQHLKAAHDKGVYATYTDFLRNQPTYSNFKIIPGAKEPARLHAIDDKGNEFPLHSVWGVQHKGKTYVMHHRMLFEIFNIENAWYWVGVKYIDSQTIATPMVLPFPGGSMYGMEGLGARVKYRPTPYLLNLDTGQPY